MEAKSDEFSYYVCGTLTEKGSGSCPSRYLNSRKLEGLVVDKVKEHILTPENLTRLAELVAEESISNSGVYEAELRTVESEIADATCWLERLYDAIETGKLGLNDVASRIQQLRYRQEQLQSRRWELETLLSDRRVELGGFHH